MRGIAGGTVLEGCVGSGHARTVHIASSECLAADPPVVIETAGAPEHVEQPRGRIDAQMSGTR